MSENVQYHAYSKESRVIWAFNISGHHQWKSNKKEIFNPKGDKGHYVTKTLFCKNTEVPFERSHFRISPTESKVRTSFNTWQLSTSDTVSILIGHRHTAHYQSTLLSLGNYLQSIVFIHVEVTSFLQAIAFVWMQKWRHVLIIVQHSRSCQQLGQLFSSFQRSFKSIYKNQGP